MSRIEPVDQDGAPAEVKSLLREASALWGLVPNVMRTMARSAPALRAWIGMVSALEQGTLPPCLRARIAILVAQINQSEYCLRAHGALGRAAGLTEEEIQDSRRGTATDRRIEGALVFVRALVENGGRLRSNDLARVRGAGYCDAEVVEMIAHVAANVFTNYLNMVTETEADFPPLPALPGLRSQRAFPSGEIPSAPGTVAPSQ